MKYSDKIFREYDIRGVFSVDYDADFATLLAKALVTFLRKSIPASEPLTVAIGRDARPSGKQLSENFINSLCEDGVEVLDLGIVPTPLVYFSTFYNKVSGAVSITGSHNPSEYNGFKICQGTSTLHGAQVQELREICNMHMEKGPVSRKQPMGKRKSFDIVSPYMSDVLKRVSLDRKLKVVVDGGNGTGGVVAPDLLRALGCDVIPLFCDPDGRFPNHHPDPTVLENLTHLQSAVKENNADLGIAYDGDADRIGVVDENTRPIFGDELMVLFSREILSRKPGAKILSEVKCSNRMYDDIRKHGGKAIMWKTGHSLLKAKMKEEGAELAGEMSGHMFFADRYYGYDDAIYASARLLEIVAKQSQPLSTLLKDLPPAVSTPELRLDCSDELKFKVVEEVKEVLRKTYKIIDIDGVRIETDTGWGLLRASNTQPVVVMRFEATTQNELSKLKEVIENAFGDAKRRLSSR